LQVVDGPVFQTAAGKTQGMIWRVHISDLDPMMHTVLKGVQLMWPSMIPDMVDKESEYSMFWSSRRGSTLQAQNVQLLREVFEANNQWRKALNARGLTPGMSMMERYSKVRASVLRLI
jgi:hypothetical protein